MTRAPATLMAARSLLLAELGRHGLASAEVGIVGDTAHAKQGNSYHLGLPEQTRTGYAASESPRDKAGLSEYASALDIGSFNVRVAGKAHDLRSFSVWLVAQCKAGTADTRDIREIIYSPDGRAVRRWDRLGRRSSGDDSHLWHTHISYFRDATKAGRDQTAVFRRYLTEIGLLEDDDMTPEQAKQLDELHETITRWRAGMPTMADGRRGIEPVKWRIRDEAFQATLGANVANLAGKDWVDEPAIVQGVLAGLTPEKIAAAIPEALTEQVAEELARRMTARAEQA
ncbi:hypothetical protein AB0J20_16235 [Micromonospora costi]|uniref:hypothetical protein n=1 Tax=Micromonospora costi TaxID=1530042 RepID=UPI00340AB6C0